ncbi:UNVERIFIED_CONTAM: hypothetical protein Sindi_1622400, partial [Sesamum indicum]
VEQAVQGSHGLDVQFAGISFLESLVSEFSPSTSTAMGLPREFHEQCRISLEQDYMKAFYCWVQYAAFNVSDRIIGANSEIPEVKVCSAALRLMLQILNWDFRGKNSIENSKRGMDIFYDGMKQENDSLRRSECILVQDIEVVDLCLRALRALASHHYKDRGDGKVGLGSHATSYKDADGKFHEGILGQFLRSLLRLLLFEDYSTDLVSSGADALLPLILCEQSVYQNLANELIERQVNQTFRSRLTNAFQSLITSNNLSSTLDRMNYQRFRKNLLSFLIEVRGFLRTV